MQKLETRIITMNCVMQMVVLEVAGLMRRCVVDGVDLFYLAFGGSL